MPLLMIAISNTSARRSERHLPGPGVRVLIERTSSIESREQPVCSEDAGWRSPVPGCGAAWPSHTSGDPALEESDPRCRA